MNTQNIDSTQNIDNIMKKMTLEEKISLLTGSESMSTVGIERLNIEPKNFADGPHGVRTETGVGNCTFFPNICALSASWDKASAELYGNALADDCIEHNIDLILAPGVNIKKNMLCGRNFEYFSEDPVLAGELGAEYINGVQKNGVGACLKHFAANNQEKHRASKSVEVDERTLREIYLKAFEIAVKKSNPASVMCAYNKVNAIWCSENKMLLNDILRDEWDYDGFVVSDWGAVHNINRALCAGLDLQMPKNDNIQAQIKEGMENGEISVDVIDKAVKRLLKFILSPKAEKKPYDRARQHKIAQDIAAAGIVMLKNENGVLPIKESDKKIAVIGEFAKDALIGGQGSAEVYPDAEWIDSPLEELKAALPQTEIKYMEVFKKREFSDVMLWPKLGEYNRFIADADKVIIFAGSMESEDTEMFDRRTAMLNPNYELFINAACDCGKDVIVVLQSGGVILKGDWAGADAVLEMWLGGEGAGKAIADVLTGRVNPSGRLPETFPVKQRTDFEYPGDDQKVEYNEKLDVGYRYYDKHPDEINFPFGHGLSYTTFEYDNLSAECSDGKVKIKLDVKNTGVYDGAEVVQVYISDVVSNVKRPIKELKAFERVFIKRGETKTVEFEIPVSELGYYNIMLRKWVTEPGRYDVMIGSSSRDIRMEKSVYCDISLEYTMDQTGHDMIG